MLTETISGQVFSAILPWCLHSSYVCGQLLSHVWLLMNPWTAARQAPLSMGIFQARMPEWVAMPYSRRSSQTRDQTQVSRIAIFIWILLKIEGKKKQFKRKMSELSGFAMFKEKWYTGSWCLSQKLIWSRKTTGFVPFLFLSPTHAFILFYRTLMINKAIRLNELPFQYSCLENPMDGEA